jgi:hypothetical protein
MGTALTLPLLAHPHAGIVVIAVNGVAVRQIDLYSPDERWVEEAIAPVPRRVKLVARLPYRFDTAALRLTAERGVLDRVSLRWGEELLWDARPGTPLGAEPLPLAGMRLGTWRVSALALRNVGLVAARTGLFVMLSFVLGLPLMRLLQDRLTTIEGYAAALSGGATIPVVASACLTRLGLTGQQSYWLALGVGLGASAVVELARRTRRKAAPQPAAASARGDLLRIVGLSFGASLLTFYPMVSWPTWFLGQNYTDAYFYFSMGEAFRDESFAVLGRPDWTRSVRTAFLISPSSTLLGLTDRNGDFFALLNTALLYGSDCRRVYAQLHLNWWVLNPLLVYCLLRRACGLRPGERASGGAWLGVLLVCCSSAYYALFTQCYTGHYLSAVFLVHGLLALGLHMQEHDRGGLAAQHHLGFLLLAGLGLTGAAAVYPAQFVLPLIAAVVFLYHAVRRRRGFSCILLVLLGLITLALWNAGIVSLLRSPAVMLPLLPRSNDLARYIVFPFFTDPRVFAEIILGLRDWARVSPGGPRILGEVFGVAAPILNTVSEVLAGLRPLVLVGAVALALYGLWRLRSRPGVPLALSAAPVVYGLAATAALICGQLYLGCKFLISLGVPLQLGMAVAAATLGSVRRLAVRIAGRIAAAAVLVLSLHTVWCDNSTWLLTLFHPAYTEARTQVGAVTDDLVELGEFAAVQSAPSTVAVPRATIVGWYDALRGTDRDRITFAHALYALRNCEYIGAAADRRPPDSLDFAIVFNNYAPPACPDRVPECMLVNTTFSVWRFHDSGAANALQYHRE